MDNSKLVGGFSFGLLLLLNVQLHVTGLPAPVPSDAPPQKYRIKSSTNADSRNGGVNVTDADYVASNVYIDVNNIHFQNYRVNFSTSSCRVEPVGDSVGVANLIQQYLESSKLFNYDFILDDEEPGKINPLLRDYNWTYQMNKWFRVVNNRGQTILNLPFNYDALSLMTLQYGVEDIPVHVAQFPPGCLTNLTEEEISLVLMDLVLRDLNPKGEIQVYQGISSVCQHWMKRHSDKRARIVERCCYLVEETDLVQCVVDVRNSPLEILNTLLLVVRVCIFLFGPLFLPEWAYAAAHDTFVYYVKLKEPTKKRIVVSNKANSGIDCETLIDLRGCTDFKLCKQGLADLPQNVEIPVLIDQYNIKVTYKKLLPENNPQVGVIESIVRSVFLCKVADMESFRSCCQSKVLGFNREGPTWNKVCNVAGRIMLVFAIVIPYYIRLVVYYLVEDSEVRSRKAAVGALGFSLMTEYNFLQYFTPTHPVLILCYIWYVAAGITIAFYGGTERKTKFQQALMDAFADLKTLSMFKALGMLVHNCLWPMSKFGILGLLIGVVIWPFLLPLSLMICAVYCVPMVFVSCRIVYYIFNQDQESQDEEENERAKPNPAFFRANSFMQRLTSPHLPPPGTMAFGQFKQLLKNLVLSISAICTLMSMMVLLSEVLFFMAEIMCLTLMGLIVNASDVLKYGSLIFLVLLYSYDCYHNVSVLYTEFNKTLFAEVKFLLNKEIDQYVQLPSDIQNNRAFKSCELSEQGEYETDDEIVVKDTASRKDSSIFWSINDLILFVDKEDSPRIPKILFEQACQIRSSGSPGPVYRQLLAATREFLIILMFISFVFLVVLSFGQSYGVSSSKQSAAGMAGGFMPFLFRYIFRPKPIKLETRMLSFHSKLQEIIKNFKQDWPACDFLFDIDTSTDDDKSEKSDEEKKEDDKKDKSDKDKSEKTWLQKIQRQTSIRQDDLWDKFHKINLKVPTDKVDILFLISEADKQWTWSHSDLGDMDTDLDDNLNVPKSPFDKEPNFLLLNGNSNDPCHKVSLNRRDTGYDAVHLHVFG